MEDNRFADITLSEKLQQEANTRTTAYDVGEFYLDVQVLGNDHNVTLYDRNFLEIANETHIDPSMTTTQAINNFCEKYEFEGAENLKTRSVTMLDPQVFHQILFEMQAQAKASQELEAGFRNSDTPQYAIYRMNDTEKHENIETEDYLAFQSLGGEVDKKDYLCIAEGNLEDLIPDYQERLNENPFELADDVQATITDFAQLGEAFEEKYGIPNSGDVFVFQHQGKEEAFFMDFTDQHKIDFQEQAPKVKEKSVEQEQTTPEQAVVQEEKDDMKRDIYLKSDKLLVEKNAGVVAYQAGEFYAVAVQGIGGSDVNLYDSNLVNVKNVSYPDMENLTEVINKFCDDFQFDGIDTLRNRSADMLDFGTFMQNYHEAYNRRETSLETESQWFGNPEDSFAIYSLNPTEHNEQLEGRNMAFMENVGEDLDKRNFHCIFTDDLASLKQNDPMFYGDTDMEQHFQEALEELQNGDGEKLLTMLEVKSPQMNGLSDELQTGCILSLKIDGEVSQYFIEESGLEKVNFIELPPKFVDKSVEEQKDKFYEELFDSTRTISDFVEQPLSSFDQTCINILINGAMDMNPEASKTDILSFVGDAINEGDILPKDFRNMDITVFAEVVADLDKSQLEPFSSVAKEEQSAQENRETPKEMDFTSLSSEELLGKMNDSYQFRGAVQEAVDISLITNTLDEPLSFEDMVKINDFSSDVWLKYENTHKIEIIDFIGNAINEGEITVGDLENISRIEFLDCLSNKDTEALGNLVASKEDVVENSALVPDITPVQGEENTFQFTVTTQERVVIQAATDHEFDHNFDHDQDYRLVLRDILDEIDPNGDLLQFYPDDYTFEINEELLEKITLTFTEEQLEVIAESCHEASIGWENIPESYREILDSIVDKIENKDKILLDMTKEAPENEPRIAAHSYDITDSVVMGGEEIAMGVAPSGAAGTWERNIVADEEKGLVDNWYSGHYFDTKDEAMGDFQQRIEDKLAEREAIFGEQSMYSEKNPENQGEKKPDGKEEKNKAEKTPRESVMAKLKEIKSQIAQKENKEQPTKTKPDQSI